MKNFYKGGSGLCLPDQNVETLHATSLRNRNNAEYNVCAIRRGRPACLPNKNGLPFHIGRTHRCAPTVLLIIFFVSMLFNNALAQSSDGREAVDGGRPLRIEDTHIHTQKWLQKVGQKLSSDRVTRTIYRFDPEADLDRYPPLIYEVDHGETMNIRVGEHLPDELLDLPLWVVGESVSGDVVTLRQYSNNQLIILDFWANFCAPCIKSVDKWESFSKQLDSGLQLLPIQLDYDYRAILTAQARDWKSPIVIGRSAYLLNSFFFDQKVISRAVWIKNGKLIAITGTEGYDLELVKAVLADKDVDIPTAYEWTYSQPNP